MRRGAHVWTSVFRPLRSHGPCGHPCFGATERAYCMFICPHSEKTLSKILWGASPARALYYNQKSASFTALQGRGIQGSIVSLLRPAAYPSERSEQQSESEASISNCILTAYASIAAPAAAPPPDSRSPPTQQSLPCCGEASIRCSEEGSRVDRATHHSAHRAGSEGWSWALGRGRTVVRCVSVDPSVVWLCGLVSI